MRVLALLTLSLLIGCEAATPASASDDELGNRTYQLQCASCHGTEGRGDGPAAAALDPKPADLTGPRPEHLRGQQGGRRAIIENGSPGTAMVGYAKLLTAAELEAVIGVVHAMRQGQGMGRGMMGRGRGQGQGMGSGQGAQGDCPGDCPQGAAE